MRLLTVAVAATCIVAAVASPFAWNAQRPMSMEVGEGKDIKVPVTLAVMSRCPDAAVCEAVFDKVVDRTVDKIDFSLSYIGQLNSTESRYGVTCMHGEEECAGNVQQLCVAKHRPRLKEWWAFVSCQNYNGRQRIGSESVARECARVAGADWEKDGLKECADGKEGVQLLRESVKHSKTSGWLLSCTIVIQGRKVCVHDGRWKECEGGHDPQDFVAQIEDAYRRLNAAP